jgi:hypothetical protein
MAWTEMDELCRPHATIFAAIEMRWPAYQTRDTDFRQHSNKKKPPGDRAAEVHKEASQK